MPGLRSRHAEFLAISDALKRCRGEEFEDHGHPAVMLDRATGPSTRVWGWWSGGSRPLPCLLWSGERGWCATVVEPDDIDGPGYDVPFWSHRIKQIDLALANALGPFRSLTMLELYTAADTTLALGPFGQVVKDALLWGIVQLRAARTHVDVHAVPATPPSKAAILGGGGFVDEELAVHALVPTLAKPRTFGLRNSFKDPGIAALVRALTEVRLSDRSSAGE